MNQETVSRVFQPGEMITKYAGYMSRGLTLEDAQLAARRYQSEYAGPNFRIEVIEFDPEKYGAVVYAVTEYEITETIGEDSMESSGEWRAFKDGKAVEPLRHGDVVDLSDGTQVHVNEPLKFIEVGDGLSVIEPEDE